MLHPISGRLASIPELKTVKVGEEEKQVANTSIYVWNGQKGENSMSIPIKITAWDDDAVKLSNVSKTEDGKMPMIHILGNMKINYDKDGNPAIGYNVKAIETDNEKGKEKFNLIYNDMKAAFDFKEIGQSETKEKEIER